MTSTAFRSQSFKLIIITAILIVLAPINACIKENKFNIPLVFTGEVKEITAEGVVFYGKIIPAENEIITDYGFVWDTQDQFLTMYNAKFSISVKGEPLEGFSANITSGFTNGKTYHVKAYVKTESGVLFGALKSFVSLGSKEQEVFGFDPLFAHFEDTLYIRGNYLPHSSNFTQVKFNDQTAQLLHASDTLIQVKIPFLNSAINEIYCTINGITYNFEEKFRILPPVIDSLSPNEAYANNRKLYIYCNGFHTGNYNKVMIGPYQGNIDFIGSNYIRTTLKPGIPSGVYSVCVITLGQESNTDFTVTILQP